MPHLYDLAAAASGTYQLSARAGRATAAHCAVLKGEVGRSPSFDAWVEPSSRRYLEPGPGEQAPIG
jgi:hypothetical protein